MSETAQINCTNISWALTKKEELLKCPGNLIMIAIGKGGTINRLSSSNTVSLSLKEPRYLNYVGRTDSALVLPLISRDLTPCMAETALAMVNI